jgi:hypothetical protein
LTIGWFGSVIAALLPMRRHADDAIEAYAVPSVTKAAGVGRSALRSAAIPCRPPQLGSQETDKQGVIADELCPTRFFSLSVPAEQGE